MHELAFFLLQNGPDPEQVQRLVMTILPLIGIMFLIGLAILIVPTWFICKKAGFSPWLSMLCLIPSLGLLVLLYVLAFADWKVLPAPQMAWTPAAPYPPYPPQGPVPPQA